MMLEQLEAGFDRAAAAVMRDMASAGYVTYVDAALGGRLVREYADGRREFIAYPEPDFACVILGPAPLQSLEG